MGGEGSVDRGGVTKPALLQERSRHSETPAHPSPGGAPVPCTRGEPPSAIGPSTAQERRVKKKLKNSYRGKSHYAYFNAPVRKVGLVTWSLTRVATGVRGDMAGGARACGLSLGAATGGPCAGHQNQAQGPREPSCSSTGLRHNPGVSVAGLALWVQLGFPGPPRAPPVSAEAQAQGQHHVLPWPGAALQSPAPDTRDPRCGAAGSAWIPQRRGVGRGRWRAQGRD